MGVLFNKVCEGLSEGLKFLLYLFGSLFHHNRESKVFYYHDIGISYTDMGTPLSLFQAHIDIIRKTGFKIVDAIDCQENQIMIAFDDGWRGIYENKDFFIDQEIHPTIFLAVDLIGQDGYLSKEEIDELIRLDFHFQAHSWTHTGLPDHHGQDLVHELTDSRMVLEGLFNQPFSEICFPQGRFSEEVIEGCIRAGYVRMYSSIPGPFYCQIRRNVVCRYLIQHTPNYQIKLILTGNVPFLTKRYYNQHFSK